MSKIKLSVTGSPSELLAAYGTACCATIPLYYFTGTRTSKGLPSWRFGYA
jgi:hypothetical protein